ncbi:hypothetical protein OSSY52_15890 [Tepiditoga spiralis]|uniref:Solute-binding protein family 3/N-terminal domain-containing protein n=1 Tax=Tepiditoga spiralis TaxID=2108365 RepID=A0A7G1G4J9_9BACT|nr:TIGR02285 family protein [Tepiditoga spiralis]BBE31448.1 hypothetical protein OSSY52_15890 [Tepiditoga spiralis]
MKKIIFFIFIFFSIIIFSNKQIKWFITNYPPAFIINKNNDFKGFEFNTLNNLIKKLNHYDITYYQTSLSRALTDMKNKKNVCALFLFKTPEREKFLYYSLPYRVTLPNGIIIRKSDKNKFKKYFDKNNKIKLESLLKERSLTLGINKKISYSKEIDDIIQKYINKPNIFLLTRENYIENLLKLLNLNRIDYFIGYAESINYLSKKLNMKDEFIYIPISEVNKKIFSILYITAPKNEFGKKIIDEVNKIILKTNFVEDAANYYKKWLDKSSINEFEKIYKIFLKQYLNKK